ncbi:MAG: site-2 protease family protein [Planctomycetota bacterium]
MNDLLSKKFPVFKVSGIQVNVHIMFLIFAAYELYDFRAQLGLGLLILGVLWTSVLLHEFGHCWGARYQGGDAHEILLWPLGGLAMCEAPMTPWSQGFVAASGPAVNVILAALSGPVLLVLPRWTESWRSMYDAVGFTPYGIAATIFFTNVGLFLFNMLIPAFPLDMGRIYQAVLWVYKGFKRSMRIACYTTFVCGGLLILHAIIDRVAPQWWSLYLSGGTTFFIAIWVIFTAYGEIQKLDAGHYDDEDEPWRATYRFHPATESEPKENEPGFIARWAARREEAKAQRDADEAQARATRLDEVLRRVAQVGMDGLTPEEKTFLEAESARLRDKR